MSNTAVIIPCRFSYVTVWEPKIPTDKKGNPQPGAKPKYSIQAIIPKSDTATVKKINDAVEAAIAKGKAEDAGWGKIAAKIKLPLRDGDDPMNEKEDDPNYQGCYFMNCTSLTQPGVLDQNKNEMLKKTDLYSGCYGKLDLNFYPFDVQNQGIAAGLNNIMKTKDGEVLGGGKKRAEDAFADEPVEDTDDL